MEKENKLIDELRVLPNVIYKRRLSMLEAQQRLEETKAALAKKETELLTSGAIEGKNAEIRNAQLRQATEAEREAVKNAEQRIEEIKAELYHAIDTFNALRSIALVIAGDKEVSLLG